MDVRWSWALWSISMIASMAGAGFAVWGLLAWNRTAAGKATGAVEAGMRVVTFRLAQIEGHLRALDATLQAEAAKTIPVAELEQLLERGVPQAALPASTPAPPRAEPTVARGETMRLQAGHVEPPRVAPPAWLNGPEAGR